MLNRQDYERFRVSPVDPATLCIADVETCLNQLAEASGKRIRVSKFSQSSAGKPIFLATLGSGPRGVLLWSQMHGDEPTHTAVLLDLLSYLSRTPAEPLAADIIAGCSLHMLPMLNPDGAELVSRFNAQGIDVNRDARRLATPEGRALRAAVEAFRPEFAFNLHNQNARTSVGDPPKPAAVSLLAPSVDARGTQPPHMRQAKQMAACFVEAVRADADGMISRYDDEFEPRAFGDTIQASGAATMLVEAGGWPAADPEPLVRLHFHGLLATLHAIATGRVGDFDPQFYESLPRSNSRKLFDCMIAGGYLLDGALGEAYKADLGIDQSRGERLVVTSRRDGKITDIGDLTTTVGKIHLDATGSLILPGRVALLDDWKPGAALSDGQLDTLLGSGTTTVLGLVDLADGDALEAMDREAALAINWSFVARLESARSLGRAELLELVALASARGALAIVGNEADESVWQHLDRFGVPLLRSEQLPCVETSESSYELLARNAAATCKLLNLDTGRGTIARSHHADLLIFNLDAALRPLPPVDWRRLERVMVSGETVWERGRPTGARPGVFLARA